MPRRKQQDPTRINHRAKANTYTILTPGKDSDTRTRVEAHITYTTLGIRKDGKTIVIDHIPTGTRVATTKTLKQAVDCVRELFFLSDFNFTTPPEDLRKPVSEILRRYQA